MTGGISSSGDGRRAQPGPGEKVWPSRIAARAAPTVWCLTAERVGQHERNIQAIQRELGQPEVSCAVERFRVWGCRCGQTTNCADSGAYLVPAA